MKINSAVFLRSAPSLEACPPATLPEFAFIGRSNVGKSSLINLITGKSGLAKASATPGKTQLMNFFAVNDAWCLADLPGYGYAKVAQAQRADFNEAVAEYLEKRENLRCVFVLLDSRLPPQRIDLEFLEWLVAAQAPFALVFTKTDKQSATQTKANLAAYEKRLLEAWEELPNIFATSATKKEGRAELLRFIAELSSQAAR